MSGAGHEVLTWHCMACGESQVKKRLKLDHLRAHRIRPTPLRCVQEVFQVDSRELFDNVRTLPPLGLSRELIEAFRKGGSLTAGFRLNSGWINGWMVGWMGGWTANRKGALACNSFHFIVF